MAKKEEMSQMPVPATTQEELPAELLDMMVEDAGKGVSTDRDDIIIPLIYILQSNSPQVKPRDPKYIEGARPGDIWMRNSIVQEIIPGDVGFWFQPCYFTKVWNEWRPNRGGFVGRHADRPRDAVEQKVASDAGEFKTMWVRNNGNNVVETRLHVGYADDQQYVLSFSSTGHTISRQWMTQINQFLIPGTNKIRPSWSMKWRLKTKDRMNNLGSWSEFSIEDPEVVTMAEYARGRALNEAMSRGEKIAADEEHAASGGEKMDDEIPF